MPGVAVESCPGAVAVAETAAVVAAAAIVAAVVEEH